MSRDRTLDAVVEQSKRAVSAPVRMSVPTDTCTSSQSVTPLKPGVVLSCSS